jgi:hypothetical protein
MLSRGFMPWGGVVVGWQRRVLIPLPSLDVASMLLPMTYDDQDWAMVIEAAVVPGHGEVRRRKERVDMHITART